MPIRNLADTFVSNITPAIYVCRRNKSYAVDEGRSLKAGLQEQALNNHKLLW
jgi:hypothetical protein